MFISQKYNVEWKILGEEKTGLFLCLARKTSVYIKEGGEGGEGERNQEDFCVKMVKLQCKLTVE